MINSSASRRLGLYISGSSLTNLSLKPIYVGASRFTLDTSGDLPKKVVTADLVTFTPQCSNDWPVIILENDAVITNAPRTRFQTFNAGSIQSSDPTKINSTTVMSLEAMIDIFISEYQRQALNDLQKIKNRYNQISSNLTPEEKENLFYVQDQNTGEFTDVVYVAGTPEDQTTYPSMLGGKGVDTGTSSNSPYYGSSSSGYNVKQSTTTVASITPVSTYIQDTYMVPAIASLYTEAMNKQGSPGDLRIPILSDIQDLANTYNGLIDTAYGKAAAYLSGNEKIQQISKTMSGVFGFFCAEFPDIGNVLQQLLAAIYGWIPKFGPCLFKNTLTDKIGNASADLARGTVQSAQAGPPWKDGTVSGKKDAVTYNQRDVDTNSLTKDASKASVPSSTEANSASLALKNDGPNQLTNVHTANLALGSGVKV